MKCTIWMVDFTCIFITGTLMDLMNFVKLFTMWRKSQKNELYGVIFSTVNTDDFENSVV